MKKTKIVCTIGPASDSKEVLRELVEAGLNVMRLNFSHGNYSEHGARIKNIKEIMKEKNEYIAVLLDTKGPEIRTMKLVDGKDVVLEAGQEFRITTDKSVVGDSNRVAVSYEGLTDDLRSGDIILLDDGLIGLTVVGIEDEDVVCRVNNTGELGENKGVNLPNVSVNLPALSEKDINDLIFGCEQEVDFVAASFIRKADDVREVRRVLDENGGKDIKIISKIENQEGVDNFDEILELSDGIMVARGDLGVEIPVEEVPFAQKRMIEGCNEAGKIVITATQMLDSMIKNPRPTRAEAGDVANAIIDGSDAVMLSGETAKGRYPVEAVKLMSRIADRTDEIIPSYDMHIEEEGLTITEAVSKGCVDAAELLKAKVIVSATETGRAPRSLRKYFPHSPIMAITNNEKTARQLAITRGVKGVYIKDIVDIDEFFVMAEKKAKELGLAKAGDIVVVSCGDKIFTPGTTNSIKVIQVK